MTNMSCCKHVAFIIGLMAGSTFICLIYSIYMFRKAKRRHSTTNTMLQCSKPGAHTVTKVQIIMLSETAQLLSFPVKPLPSINPPNLPLRFITKYSLISLHINNKSFCLKTIVQNDTSKMEMTGCCG